MPQNKTCHINMKQPCLYCYSFHQPGLIRYRKNGHGEWGGGKLWLHIHGVGDKNNNIQEILMEMLKEQYSGNIDGKAKTTQLLRIGV